MSSDNPLADDVKTDEQETHPGTVEQTAQEPAADVAEESRQETAPATGQLPLPFAESAATVASPAAVQSEPSDEEHPANVEPPQATEPPAPAVAEAAVSADAASAEGDGEAASPIEAPTSAAPPLSPRPRLNPKVDAASAKPVPTVAVDDAASAQAAPPQETQPAESSESEPPPAAPPPRPIELPSRDVTLDADLEAEIEAAFQADENAPASAVVVQQADDDGEAPDEDPMSPGVRLKGKVQSVHGDNVFFEIGGRSPGVVSARQFPADKPPQVGDEFDVVVDRVDEAEGLVMLSLPGGRRSPGGNWDAVSKGQVVDCLVNKTNKGGLEVTVSSLRGFMPASQVDLSYVGDLETYVGQKLTAVITEANPKKRNLVVSRRAFLEIERKEAAKELWQSLAEGQQFSGTVKTIKDYGAFVDIGGVDGFLHVGEISWTRLNHPSDVLSAGQPVEVQVIKLERDKKRISLGMKQLQADPWTLAGTNYPVGSAVSGRVTRTMDFGAFVELEPGVEGLVHISELDYQRVNKVTDVLNVNQHIELKVLEVDQDRRRIGLSLKQLKEKPPELQKSPGAAGSAADAEPEAPPAPRPIRKDLKGGTGPETAGGGLFGNPNDFS